jgi:lipopolysaccharide heptosyltransferase II
MRPVPGKILIIRLSSIGDIVLTSPVIRSLRNCLPESRIHFLTKKAYAPLLAHHPGITRLHLFEGNMKATVEELRAEGFDLILDLHRNIRSRIIKTRLGVPALTYEKDRWPVLLYMKFRIGTLPERHTVERYAVTLKELGCQLDDEGLEFHLPDEYRTTAAKTVADHFPDEKPVAVVLGGKFATKKWPTAYFISLLNQLQRPVILLGGPDEAAEAQTIKKALEVPVMVAAGKADLLESAALMATSSLVITHDTGLMHIAVALKLPVCSIWGSTVPEIGFAPYRAENAIVVQHPGPLPCRPCSKLGHDKCPKGHFKCMTELRPEMVLNQIRQI